MVPENYASGWDATVSEHPSQIYLAYHAFRAVYVPKGDSEVVFKYTDKYFRTGLYLSLTSIVGLLLFLTWDFVNGYILRLENEIWTNIKLNMSERNKGIYSLIKLPAFYRSFQDILGVKTEKVGRASFKEFGKKCSGSGMRTWNLGSRNA